MYVHADRWTRGSDAQNGRFADSYLTRSSSTRASRCHADFDRTASTRLQCLRAAADPAQLTNLPWRTPRVPDWAPKARHAGITTLEVTAGPNLRRNELAFGVSPPPGHRESDSRRTRHRDDLGVPCCRRASSIGGPTSSTCELRLHLEHRSRPRRACAFARCGCRKSEPIRIQHSAARRVVRSWNVASTALVQSTLQRYPLDVPTGMPPGSASSRCGPPNARGRLA